MHEIYDSNDFDMWLSYYGNQALQTGFGMDGYKGTPYQRGAGLGSFFKALFRMAIPVIRSAGKQVGKHALTAGANIMTDLVKGQPVLDSVKKHSRAETSKLFGEASQALQEGEGLGRIQKSINTRKVLRKYIKPRNKDLFSKQNVFTRYKIGSEY